MPASRSPGACDTCKRRKVKCDLANPCANCRIAHLQCAYTVVPRRRGRKAKVSRNAGAGRDLGCLAADSLPTSPNPYEEQLLEISPSSTPSLLNNASSPSIVSSEQAFTSSNCNDPTWISRHLETAVDTAYPESTIANVVDICIDLFMQYIFPNQPLIQEARMRASARLFLPHDHPCFISLVSPSGRPELSSIKAFTLLTALCAKVISVLPEHLMPQSERLSHLFLQASRSMLRIYEDHDMEHPDSSSLTIRMWHSAAFQNTTGRLGASWHTHGEASLIAQRLRLFEETSVRQYPAPESQLLRNNFWLLYLAEKTASVYENRPVVLDEALFHGELTVLECGDEQEALLDMTRKHNKQSLESQILKGFHHKRRVWSAAASLITGINSYARQKQQSTLRVGEAECGISRSTELYLIFNGLFDDITEWIRGSFDIVHDSCDENVSSYQKTCFTVLRSNILTTYYCLSLIILQRCIEKDTLEIMGFSDNKLLLASKKIDVANDFLRELNLAPFLCFKIQGETAVERIRSVGAIILEVVQTVDNDRITIRSTATFQRLLDFLAKLDSKASIDLGSQCVR